MPELKQMTFPVTKLREGDITTYGPIVNVDRKTKWAYVTTQGKADQTVHRVLLNDEWTISREIQTEEERRQDAVAFALRRLDRAEASDRSALQAARENMISELQAGEFPNHWHWLDVPLQAYAVRFWDNLARWHRGVYMHADEPLTRIEAFRQFLDKQISDKVQYFSATSRSSGQISNLFEDIELQALAGIKRDMEMWLHGV